MPLPHLVFLISITILWGGNFVAVKIGLNELSPLLLSTLRFAAVLVLLAPWLRIKPGQMKGIFWVALAGGPLHFAAIFVGLDLIGGAASAAMLAQLSVPCAILLAMIFLRERVGPWRLVGMGLAFLGVAVMSFDPGVFAHLDGVAVMIVSQIAYGVAAILMRGLKGVSVFELQAWMALLSAPVLFVASLIFETGQWQQLANLSWTGVGAITYTVIAASILGHGGIYYLYQRHPVSVITPYLLLTPICGVFAAVFVLGEVLTPRMIMGGIIIFAGVALVTLRERQRAQQMGV